MIIIRQFHADNFKVLYLILLMVFLTSCSWNKNDILYKKNDMFYKADKNLDKPGQAINKIELPDNKDLLAAMGFLPFKENRAINYWQPDNDNNIFYSEYSNKMGVSFKGNENRELLAAIDKWLGTPYLWGGCSQYGIDCSCLIKNIYKDVFDVSLDRISFMIFENNVMLINKNELRAGDLLAFEMDDAGISHVGIYINDNKFVHASLSKGVIISSLDNNYYKSRFISGGRVKVSQSIELAKLSIEDFPGKDFPGS